ncbi:hypothetical protein ATY41_00910 [Leifsonia xyli subsp. xyli]|uniref:Glycin rich protein n=2 Tax=Leifsonia xyli subsp. xyli TaxID=59736 RepID=Q6ADD8_LEIXX|nr:hypothetical protein [Leifsonia xyli]AAT89606.1 glycin rich protein [Leifsonia xyli subsp. xyli str. CTCB07]ODA91284.1 hypothetical protein ATY41_00910 [Leifsonia xyli subsp. xyli]
MAPITDAELGGYANSLQGPLTQAAAAAGHWWNENWEYVAGGAMVIAGGVLMATGIGGTAGMMLIGAGANTIIQKATTGTVNWGEVAISGLLGGFGGAGIAARAGLTGMKAAVTAGASSGGVSGGVMNTYSYYTGPGPHTVLGGLNAAGTGIASGALLGGAGGTTGQVVSQKLMGAVTHNPTADTMIMGRDMAGGRIQWLLQHDD